MICKLVTLLLSNIFMIKQSSKLLEFKNLVLHQKENNFTKQPLLCGAKKKIGQKFRMFIKF